MTAIRVCRAKKFRGRHGGLRSVGDPEDGYLHRADTRASGATRSEPIGAIMSNRRRKLLGSSDFRDNRWVGGWSAVVSVASGNIGAIGASPRWTWDCCQAAPTLKSVGKTSQTPCPP